jgi:hypothetical protein
VFSIHKFNKRVEGENCILIDNQNCLFQYNFFKLIVKILRLRKEIKSSKTGNKTNKHNIEILDAKRYFQINKNT